MDSLDTNVLVRYFTNDDEVQSKIASELIVKYIGKEKSLFISNIVICELLWVLRRGYKYKKSQIIELLTLMFSGIEFEFENLELLWISVEEYKKYNSDFSDILIAKIANQRNCKTIFTFDLDASVISEFTYLTKLDNKHNT